MAINKEPIPIRFYLRRQLIGNKYSMEGKKFIYVYKNFHGNVEGLVKAFDSRGAQRAVRRLFPDAQFFRTV